MLYSNNTKSKASYLYQKGQASSSSQADQQSSCSQCKHNTYGIREQDDQDQSSHVQRRHRSIQSSQQDDHQISVPMRKHINNKNYEFQGMLRQLQYEVDTLKKQNQTKDEIIKDLKFYVHKNIVDEQRKRETDKQANEINRLRQELGCSPRNQSFGMQAKGFRAGSLSKQYNNNIDQSVNNNKRYNPKIDDNSQNMQHSFNPRLYTTSQQHQLYNIPKNQSYIPADFELKLALLQKQLRQYQLQMIQQKQTITKLQQQNKWQQKFIISFVKMCEQLSLNYGEKLKLNKLGDDLKKKTKLSWNYMKNLVAYFIESMSSNGYTEKVNS